MIFPYTATSAYEMLKKRMSYHYTYVLEINNNDLFHEKLTDVLIIYLFIV